MSDEKPPQPPLLFRPDTFFLKPWRGWGVVRDARGRTLDRFECHGQGQTGTRSASTKMTFEFASGKVQTTEWDILSDDEGHFYARDVRTGQEGRGHPIGGDFRWVFMAPAPGPLGRWLKVRSQATYTLVAPDTALGVTVGKLFGLTVTTVVTFFRHVQP
ncbi:MAG: DUF3833 domain-containing protein [Caulobacteraceae bacterium]|nr:DUF3833 domain-containing protein [Caulobacteraceae bacterium]